MELEKEGDGLETDVEHLELTTERGDGRRREAECGTISKRDNGLETIVDVEGRLIRFLEIRREEIMTIGGEERGSGNMTIDERKPHGGCGIGTLDLYHRDELPLLGGGHPAED